MFFLSKLFSRYKKRAEKVQLVLSVIEGLRISQEQKQMYRDSLSMLDEAAVERFYEQLQDLFDFFDQRDAIEEQKKTHETVLAMRARADSDRSDDNAEFLLNTI